MKTLSTVLSLIVLAVLFYYVSATESYDWPVKHSPAATDVVVALGDSLTFGQGASPDANYPAHLSRLLNVEVINMGRNGDTSESGASRVAQVTREKPDVVLITLGGNDILRKVPVEKTLANLDGIFARLQESGAMVVYVGLDPPMFGGNRMAAIGQLCKEHQVLFVPAVMKGMWTDRTKMSDQIHPNGEGYGLIAERIYDRLKDHIK